MSLEIEIRLFAENNDPMQRLRNRNIIQTGGRPCHKTRIRVRKKQIKKKKKPTNLNSVSVERHGFNVFSLTEFPKWNDENKWNEKPMKRGT